MKNEITLAVNDSVVLRLDDGTEQSAVLTHFSLKNRTHRYAHFTWKSGPNTFTQCELHSAKWTDRVLAVFPKDSKFLAV